MAKKTTKKRGRPAKKKTSTPVPVKKNTFNKDYIISVSKKVLETLISVKVWIIFSILIVSTYLLIKGYISGQVWGTVNTAVISTIAAIREGFKISRAKDTTEIEKLIELGRKMGMNKDELYQLLLAYESGGQDNALINVLKKRNVNVFI